MRVVCWRDDGRSARAAAIQVDRVASGTSMASLVDAVLVHAEGAR